MTDDNVEWNHARCFDGEKFVDTWSGWSGQMSDEHKQDIIRIEAKRKLYSILLRKEHLTDAEINIAYELSKDDEIQDFFHREGFGIDK